MPANGQAVPIQPVDQPILCNPYDEPADHWVYDRETGEAKHGGIRRPAGYWYKTDRVGAAQHRLFLEEERDDLPLVNMLRDDVRRWREAGYRGAEPVTRELLQHWARPDRARRLFFCQCEAVETIIYLAEIRIPGRTSRTGFKQFALSDPDLAQLLKGERPSFHLQQADVFPTLVDIGETAGALPLRRLGCKMATGSGKTVVMAMLISWAFCNRGRNPGSRGFPSGVLVVCPNLTVKERLSVLRPEDPRNYYAEFDLVPVKYRPLMNAGRVLVTNWHGFAPESEHKEGDKTFAVVNKGEETPDLFARRVLDELYDRLPIMVLNDEGHHCWRPAPSDDEMSADEKASLEKERVEARVWLDGLDRINNFAEDGAAGISFCVDLSATPFYLKGSGHPEGRPFPWLVSDFGLVDAIESGIVKIPRLPVLDTTGRPDPKYFRLWQSIVEAIEPADRHPGRAGKPKGEAVYSHAEGALLQIAGQWKERFEEMKSATPGQERVPPVLIIVCDNTEIAEVFYRNISGETETEDITEQDVDDVLNGNGDEDDAAESPRRRGKKPKRRVVYSRGRVFPDYLSNTPTEKRTIRIDTKLLAEAESEDPKKNKQTAAEELRRVVATVGKRGEPGEFVRCVVSVAMLTEGWDANNVTNVLGIRAFGSQLLCEQVVGRGLRRMDYTPDPTTGRLTPEYVDVYGIPFSVIPFKGRTSKQAAPEDKPKNHVHALPERSEMEIRFPVVEGFTFALRRNLIRCNVAEMEDLAIEPSREPTATYVCATIGYREGSASQGSSPVEFINQDRSAYYALTHLQTIKFQIAQLALDHLVGASARADDKETRVLRLQSRHQLFPQVYRFVEEYIATKVDFQGAEPAELGLDRYVRRVAERLRDAIHPDESQGEPPVLPVLNRYKSIGTSADVSFKTTKSCRPTRRSHVNQVVQDTATWEASAAFRLELAADHGLVDYYVRNEGLDFVIRYEYMGIDHGYEPDFLVRLKNGITIVLEIKGMETDQDRAKHNTARRWVEAVNNWGQLGTWTFHVCRNPQMLETELRRFAAKS